MSSVRAADFYLPNHIERLRISTGCHGSQAEISNIKSSRVYEQNKTMRHPEIKGLNRPPRPPGLLSGLLDARHQAAVSFSTDSAKLTAEAHLEEESADEADSAVTCGTETLLKRMKGEGFRCQWRSVSSDTTTCNLITNLI